MHTESLEKWRHDHVYLGHAHGEHERKLKLVIALTAAAMVVEIAAGFYFGSMALLADGWHMATHAGALSISAAAYVFARRRAADARFTFGTGKVGDLAGFASAIILSLVALWLVAESAWRLASPVTISFAESLVVAVLGLGVNLLSAWLLQSDHSHGHSHADHGQHVHADHNIRSAYMHVLADALTSVLAIAGLAAGLLLGWIWMDALMGIVGGLVIARWSYGLIRDTGAVLLDMTPDPAIAQKIRATLETGGDRVADLHLWRVGPGHYSAIVSLVTHRPERPSHYRERLRALGNLSHVTIEIDTCCDP
ncbi:MAG TPA: CDF family Co(II)/Ni(II) efflux transporter DmeF [Dongiaceae bacterium]